MTGLEDLVRRLLIITDPKPERSGLLETPRRFAKAWLHWTSGYNQKPKDVLKTFEDGAEAYDEMVFQANIPMFSTCEHHLAPFFGVAHIGYLPRGRIVGLSKLSRLTDIFARRLTVQERVTSQIANALMDELQPWGVGVVLRCRHLCMESRGIQKAGTITYTSCLLGAMRDPENPQARSEFLRFVEIADAKLTI